MLSIDVRATSHALGVVMLLAFPATGMAKNTLFQCQNENRDAEEIQSLIESSSAGDRIVISGTCLITTKIWIRQSHITISGIYDDTNRNGPDADDWKTVMRGTGDSPYTASSDAFTIAPAPGPGDDPGSCVNAGREVEELQCNGVTHHVKIEKFKFFRVQRAINAVGGHEHYEGGRGGGCDYTPTLGSVEDITIRNNWMDQVRRAAQVEGRARNITIDGNLVTTTSDAAFPVFSEWVGCDAAPVGPVEHYTLSNNIATGVAGRAVALQGPGEHFQILNNELASSGNGFFNCPRTWQQDGVVNISGNRFIRENAANADVYISSGSCNTPLPNGETTSSNIKIIGNDFSSPLPGNWVNVVFAAGTFDNLLVTGKNKGIRFQDFGANRVAPKP